MCQNPQNHYFNINVLRKWENSTPKRAGEWIQIVSLQLLKIPQYEKINIPEQDNVDNKKYKLTSCEIPIILVNKNQEYPFMFGQSKAKILSTFNNKYIIDNEYYNDKYSRYFPKRKWL